MSIVSHHYYYHYYYRQPQSQYQKIGVNCDRGSLGLTLRIIKLGKGGSRGWSEELGEEVGSKE